MNNKLIMLITANLTTAIVVIGIVFSLSSDDNQSLSVKLTSLHKNKLVKAQTLEQLKQQLKINEIDLIGNIDDVKQFIKSNGTKLSMNKVKANKRGMEYLLTGKSVDVLVLLYRLINNNFKVDMTRLDFRTQDKLIAELTILGAEK